MLVDYVVTDMGTFGNYLDAVPRSKTMRGDGITTFIFHVSQCIIINQTKFVTALLIPEDWLNSLYLRLDFNTIKEFATSPYF